MKKKIGKETSFITDLIQEECDRDQVFKREYEADKLAEKLKRARTTSRIPLRAVAEAMKIAQPNVSRMENGLEKVSVGKLLEYVRAIGYEVEIKKSRMGPLARQDSVRRMTPRKIKTKA